MENQINCYFCHALVQITMESDEKPTTNQPRRVECIDCKPYILSNAVFNALQQNSTKEKLKNNHISSRIRGWIYEQYQTDSTPTINEELFEFFLKVKPMDVYEKGYRLLQYLNKKTLSPGTWMHEKDVINENTGLFYAHDAREIEYLLKYLIKKDFLDRNTNGGANSKIRITPEGFAYLEEYNKKFDSTIAFCAMWFDKTIDPLWLEAIEPAIREAGYDAKRIDKHFHNKGIMDEIMALIRRSKFIIADFTGNRGGVYFEAGFAMGLGMQVIFTCKKEDFESIDPEVKVHFDVSGFNYLLWEQGKLDDFKNKLRNRIEATLGQGLKI